ncbi:hypothetical protein [Hyphomicrobium sp.]|uniref:hypothetical protein n=1 Tax=Hyphomicrobium sp. TaxID=82 RepID=UPI001DC5D05A|nr:hypothetical protein [Hyphomicrobium sp.]MBY0561958.1 hypothetical protein [Hyphomicrobium sp.]
MSSFTRRGSDRAGFFVATCAVLAAMYFLTQMKLWFGVGRYKIDEAGQSSSYSSGIAVVERMKIEALVPLQI